MIPTVLVNPSSTARCAIFNASSGSFTPLPSTELMFTWNTEYSASHSSRTSSVFKLFFDTSSGTRLSMLICKCSNPASFSVPIRSLLSKNPLVIIPAMIPRFRMCRIISSSSGCISGSPPLMVMIDVPMSAKISSRFFISSGGTGFDTLSYSLQYPQSRLHRRIGMMCTKTGCLVEASALAIIFSSRARVRRNLRRRSSNTSALAFAAFVSSGMNSASSPRLQLYTTPQFPLPLRLRQRRPCFQPPNSNNLPISRRGARLRVSLPQKKYRLVRRPDRMSRSFPLQPPGGHFHAEKNSFSPDAGRLSVVARLEQSPSSRTARLRHVRSRRHRTHHAHHPHALHHQPRSPRMAGLAGTIRSRPRGSGRTPQAHRRMARQTIRRGPPPLSRHRRRNHHCWRAHRHHYSSLQVASQQQPRAYQSPRWRLQLRLRFPHRRSAHRKSRQNQSRLGLLPSSPRKSLPRRRRRHRGRLQSPPQNL